MNKINFIFFIALILGSLCQNEIELDIAEGVYSYTFEPKIKYNITLKAVDSGNYIIIFPDSFQIIEATGDVHESLYDSSFKYKSRVYAQKVNIGDYIKLEYPESFYDIKNTEIKKIRIEKKNAYFAPNTRASPLIFNIVMNNSKKPMYIFLDNALLKGLYNICYTFHAKIHSGKFFGSYRTTEFDPDFPIDKDFQDFNISSLTDLPYDYYNHHLVIIKLQCKEPGLISIFIARGDYLNILNTVGLQVIKEDYDFNLKINKGKAYLQVINLYGNTSINLTEYNDKIYNDDFYKELEITEYITKTISFKNFGSYSMILTSMTDSESKIILEKEYETIEVKPSKRVAIPLLNINNKKFIKISSTLKGFYWDYQYSQTSDINFLPSSPYTSSYHFKKGNVGYIDNPYKYNNQKKHFNYMFITFMHKNEENSTFYYEYTDENDLKEEETEEEENDKYLSDKDESDKDINDKDESDKYESDKDRNEKDRKENESDQELKKNDGSSLLIYQKGILLMLVILFL